MIIMIELKVDISRVEYSDVFDRYIPNLLNSLKEKGEIKHPALRLAAKRPAKRTIFLLIWQVVKQLLTDNNTQKKDRRIPILFLCI